jgi:hypothetical protein
VGGKAWKTIGVAAGVALAGILIGFYISGYLVGNSKPFTPRVSSGAPPSVHLTIQTVAAVGPVLAPNANWVSYLIRDDGGHWLRSTVWKLPANTLVHVTIYNFDGASGLRNPLFARAQGVDGNTMVVDGKTLTALNPDDASHTFAVAQYGLVVPIAAVPDGAKNPCGFAPCSLSSDHRTIQFTFHTGAKGHYRWQCLVPCAAGWIDGFGGPMQTIGYMDGFLDVV